MYYIWDNGYFHWDLVFSDNGIIWICIYIYRFLLLKVLKSWIQKNELMSLQTTLALPKKKSQIPKKITSRNFQVLTILFRHGRPAQAQKNPRSSAVAKILQRSRSSALAPASTTCRSSRPLPRPSGKGQCRRSWQGDSGSG